jgi:glycosyltransferase involved in cell wall biosynthesis
MPNENYSRVICAMIKLMHRSRFGSLMIVDNEFNRGAVDRLLVPLYGLTFSRLLAASQAAGKPFRYITPKKLEVIYPGVDIEYIRRRADRSKWRTPPAIKSRNLNIAIAGLLVDIKRPDFAIKVFARFLRNAPGKATLHVIGEGVLDGKLRRLARVLKLTEGKDIIFWGHLERDLFLSKLTEADVLLHPSTTESFGRVVVEAQALGVPVIVSRAGGMPEVVVDGQTGFVVQKDDMNGFLERLRLLASDMSLRTAMSRNAYTHAEKFDVKCALPKYTRVFKELLGK